MRIISHGSGRIKMCSNCNCVFEYEINDIKKKKYHTREDVGILFPRYESITYIDEYINCPDCNEFIEIRSYHE